MNAPPPYPAPHRTGPRRGALRAVLTTAVLAILAFAVGGVAGFVYEHEPQRDVVHVLIDRTAPAPAEVLVRGPLTEVAAGAGAGARRSVVVQTGGGPVTIELAADTPADELLPVAAGVLSPGTAVNIGGERGTYGLMLTGVVAVDGAP